jgi:hypothetical protein
MIGALAADEHNGDSSKEPEDLRVELVVRGTTGPVRSNNDSA